MSDPTTPGQPYVIPEGWEVGADGNLHVGNITFIQQQPDQPSEPEDPRSGRQKLIDAGLLPDPERASAARYVHRMDPTSTLHTELFNLLCLRDRDYVDMQRNTERLHGELAALDGRAKRMEKLLQWIRAEYNRADDGSVWLPVSTDEMIELLDHALEGAPS